MIAKICSKDKRYRIATLLAWSSSQSHPKLSEFILLNFATGGRPPADSFTEISVYKTIYLPLFIVMSVAAILGICLSIFFFAFSVIYSDRR